MLIFWNEEMRGNYSLGYHLVHYLPKTGSFFINNILNRHFAGTLLKIDMTEVLPTYLVFFSSASLSL